MGHPRIRSTSFSLGELQAGPLTLHDGPPDGQVWAMRRRLEKLRVAVNTKLMSAGPGWILEIALCHGESTTGTVQ